MAKIEFITADDVSYVSVGELVKRSDFSGTAGSVPANARSESEMATYFEGSEERPQLVEVRRAPNSVAEPHAHGHDEIIFVLEGELRFGARVCGPGSAALIPGHTLYGFVVGPQGCRFLNFRPVKDTVYLTKNELAGERTKSDA